MISAVYYINLAHRTDRNSQIISELSKTKLSPDIVKRIDAIKNDNGHLGCSYSHIYTLKKALLENSENDWIIVLEDDYEIKNHETFLNDIEETLRKLNPSVLLLATGNPRWCKFTHIQGTRYKKAHTSENTGGYVVNMKFVPTLMENFIEGSKLLEKGDNVRYHIDVHWHKLQQIYEFIAFEPPIGHQSDGYSDILKTQFVDFNK